MAIDYKELHNLFKKYWELELALKEDMTNAIFHALEKSTASETTPEATPAAVPVATPTEVAPAPVEEPYVEEPKQFEMPTEAAPETATATAEPSTTVSYTIADVRTAFVEAQKRGFSPKDYLIKRYGYAKLSEVPAEDYADLIKDAQNAG